MKLFEQFWFNVILVSVFIVLLIIIGLCPNILHLNSVDVPVILTNATLMFLSGLITISLPLYASFWNEDKRRKNEQKMAIIAVARYVGNEILDNLIEIDDMLANNKKSLGDMGVDKMKEADARTKRLIAAIWRAATEELSVSLYDKHHKNLITSGLVARIDDDDVGTGIRETYQKLDNLKKRLRRISIFLGMLLEPKVKLDVDFESYNFNVKLPDAIRAVSIDITAFQEECNKTVGFINHLLKPYGKELKIIHEVKKEENE